MRVYIAQLKCPLGHCVAAEAGEYDDDDEARLVAPLMLMDEMADLVEKGEAEYKCGICGSTDLGLDVGRTPFETMEAALPHLQKAAAANAMARRALKGTPN